MWSHFLWNSPWIPCFWVILLFLLPRPPILVQAPKSSCKDYRVYSDSLLHIQPISFSSTQKSPPFLHLLLKFPSLSSKASELLEPSRSFWNLSSLPSITFLIMPYACRPDPAAVLWTVLFSSTGCPEPCDLATAPPKWVQSPYQSPAQTPPSPGSYPWSHGTNTPDFRTQVVSTAPHPPQTAQSAAPPSAPPPSPPPTPATTEGPRVTCSFLYLVA